MATDSKNPTGLRRLSQVVGFFLACRICITLLAFQSEPVVGTEVTISASLALLFCCWFMTSHQKRSLDPGTLRWIGAYLLLAGGSLLWSETRTTTIALAYWASLVADCASVYLLASGEDAQPACHEILRGFVVGAAVVGLIAWFLPTLPDLRIGNEDFLHPNALGYVLALATLFALQLARRSRGMAALAIFCGATLLRTLSKASIAAFLGASVFLLLRDSHLRRRTKIATGIVMGVLIASSWGLLETYATTYEENNQIETLTGRTYIWTAALEESLKKPWFGHGFYSFRFVIPALGDFEPWQAHNELLQQFFCYGVIGLAVFLGLYGSFVKTIRRYRGSELTSLAAALMVFALIRGLVDTERFDVNYPLWLLTLFVLVLQSSGQEFRSSLHA